MWERTTAVKSEDNSQNDLPDIKYPGDDPNISHGDSWKWRDPKDKGAWHNPKTGETLHPDLDHPTPEGPLWDYIPYKNGP